MLGPPRTVQLNEANAFIKQHPEVLYVDLLIADPREVLRQVVERFDSMGLTICAAFELEFYLID